MGRLSIHKLKEWKRDGRRLAMLTAYDYAMARLVEQAGSAHHPRGGLGSAP